MEPEVSKFCLKWNSHHLVLVDALLEREWLVEITLVKEDQFICGHHHHVLLSCSQYFAVGCLFCFVINCFIHFLSVSQNSQVNESLEDRLASFMGTIEALKIIGKLII